MTMCKCHHTMSTHSTVVLLMYRVILFMKLGIVNVKNQASVAALKPGQSC